MIYIHDNEVNHIDECNLLHDIINPPKRAKNMNRDYSPILLECMNTRKGRARFQNFRIILDSVCSSIIVTRILVEKLCPEKDAVMQWQTQTGKISTNFRVKVNFTLPALIATNVVMWKCHVDDSTRCR